MSKPYIHALSSVRKWGGLPEDYLPIHDLLDTSKGTIADSRHRALTHNSWFLSVILERIFGHNIVNKDGRQISVRDIGEQHVLEDYGGRYIPSAQDFLQEMEMKEWMVKGMGAPPSFAKLVPKNTTKRNTCILMVRTESTCVSIIKIWSVLCPAKLGKEGVFDEQHAGDFFENLLGFLSNGLV